MDEHSVSHSHYIETLASRIDEARPFWSDETTSAGDRQAHALPDKPGIYLLMRRVNVEEDGYRNSVVNLAAPMVLYVGKAGNLHNRMRQHFGGTKPNYQSSQFARFLFQVCQDHDMVSRILASPDTIIAYVVIEEGGAVVDHVESLAVQVFQPRFNIKNL